MVIDLVFSPIDEKEVEESPMSKTCQNMKRTLSIQVVIYTDDILIVWSHGNE